MIKYKAKFKEDDIFFEKGVTEVQLKDEPTEIYIVTDELVSGKVWIGTKKVQENLNTKIYEYTTQIHLDNILSITNKNISTMIDQKMFKTLEKDLNTINFKKEQDIIDIKLETLKKEFSKPITDKRENYRVQPPDHLYNNNILSCDNEELPDILTEIFSDTITEKEMEEFKEPQITENTVKDTIKEKREESNKYNVVELMTNISNDFSSLTDETKQLLTFLVDYAANKLKEDINK